MFILLANQWTDRLKVLAWSDTLATATGARSACSVAHVQQLVVHWMTMGSLDSPFAATSTVEITRRHGQTPTAEADTRGERLMSELAVHRESLGRMLRENPESLVSILEALTEPLMSHSPEIHTRVEMEKAEVYEFSEA